MQNPIQKFRQNSIAFVKPGILSEKLKIWRAPTTLQFNIFCWNFAHVSYLPMPKKGCVGFYLFCLDLEILATIKKNLVSKHSFFTLSLINQDLNKI